MRRMIKWTIMMLLVLMYACEDSKQEARLELRLTDAPASYEEVLIDIQDVTINLSADDEESGWRSLDDVNHGVYNLLDFTNGLDTLLGEHSMPAGKISQMRLVLGDNNQVKVDGEYYDLKTPSGQTSGLKLNIHAQLEEGITYRLWLDFDAGRSVVKKGNGSYSLKPVIRTYTEATSGAIEGNVEPVDARPYVMAISASRDTFGTYSDTVSGAFMIKGLNEGIYDIELIPKDEYTKKEIEDVEVQIGVSTNLGLIEFQK